MAPPEPASNSSKLAFSGMANLPLVVGACSVILLVINDDHVFDITLDRFETQLMLFTLYLCIQPLFVPNKMCSPCVRPDSASYNERYSMVTEGASEETKTMLIQLR